MIGSVAVKVTWAATSCVVDPELGRQWLQSPGLRVSVE